MPSIPVIMESLSERYGWTPKEIMEQDNDIIDDYFDIANLRSKLEKAESKKAKRK